jgi:hypothetical protein
MNTDKNNKDISAVFALKEARENLRDAVAMLREASNL